MQSRSVLYDAVYATGAQIQSIYQASFSPFRLLVVRSSSSSKFVCITAISPSLGSVRGREKAAWERG